MQTTLGHLANAEPALARLAAQRMPAKAAYVAAKLVRAVADEVKHFHAQRESLIRELGKEQDGRIEVQPANLPDFVTRLNELARVEVELAASPVDLACVTDITPEDLLLLGDLVTGEPA